MMETRHAQQAASCGRLDWSEDKMTQSLAANARCFATAISSFTTAASLRRFASPLPSRPSSSSPPLLSSPGPATPPPASSQRSRSRRRGMSASRLFAKLAKLAAETERRVKTDRAAPAGARRSARQRRRRPRLAPPPRLLPGRGRPGRPVRRAKARPDLQAAVQQLEEARQPAERRDRHSVRQAGQDRPPSPAATAFAPIRSRAAPRCMPASTCRARSERRSMRPPTAPSRPPARTAAATATSSRSTTAAASKRATATCPRSTFQPGQQRHPRPADRPHGLDRPLDRQPPSL